jgi:hypothetical protein
VGHGCLLERRPGASARMHVQHACMDLPESMSLRPRPKLVAPRGRAVYSLHMHERSWHMHAGGRGVGGGAGAVLDPPACLHDMPVPDPAATMNDGPGLQNARPAVKHAQVFPRRGHSGGLRSVATHRPGSLGAKRLR